ncbi:hypothetical protein [Maricaulis sp.]|uniref:hypothetical protein n=1 Tax=Maricaulis sp. TaxID=1486257 RepID=UPI003A8CEEBE
MPLIHDISPNSKRRYYRVFQLDYPSAPEVEKRPVDLWVYETRDSNDPDIFNHEGVWCVRTSAPLGAMRANFSISRTPDRNEADICIGHTDDRRKAGWIREHKLRGLLLPSASNELTSPHYTRPLHNQKKFHARMGTQGIANPLTYVEVGGDFIRYIKNGSECYRLDLATTQPVFSPRGFSQIFGYGDITFNALGRSYEAPNLGSARELAAYIKSCQKRMLANATK